MTAINVVGDSAASNPGNGALIPTLLGAPYDLIKNRNQTTINQISFNWTAPEDVNGLATLDYSVEKYNETTQDFTVIATNLTQ